MRSRPLHIALYRKWFKWRNPRDYWHQLNYKPEVTLENNEGETKVSTITYKKNRTLQTQPLSQLKNTFASQSLYLVGTGPSINQQDIKKLKNKNLIMLNGSITLCQSHQLEPAFYMVVDEGFIRRRMSFIKLIPKGTPCVFSIGVIRNILNVHPEFFNEYPCYLIGDITQPYEKPRQALQQFASEDVLVDDDIGFSFAPFLGYVDGATVMYTAAQLAIYLSASEIVLVGFDLGNADQPRFYETRSRRDKSGLYKAMDKIVSSFTLLSTLCQDKNITLSNASPISEMPYTVIPYNAILEKRS